jgi:hypothetical protein
MVGDLSHYADCAVDAREKAVSVSTWGYFKGNSVKAAGMPQDVSKEFRA